jgi:hypothetical protein
VLLDRLVADVGRADLERLARPLLSAVEVLAARERRLVVGARPAVLGVMREVRDVLADRVDDPLVREDARRRG